MEAFDFHWKLVCGVRRFKEQTERLTQPFCLENGITPLQLRVLLTLSVEGPQTVSELARNSHTAGANISAQAKRLAAQGYLLRRRMPRDERVVHLSLSPKGKELVRSFSDQCNETYKELATQLSAEDREIILAGLSRLESLLEAEEKPLGRRAQ